MYTVLRMTGDRSKAQVAADRMNAMTTGTVSPRARADGFAATISDSDAWDDHVRALEAFVEAHRESLAAAAESGLSIEVDTMVVTDDVAGRPITSFTCPPRLHRDLGAVGAALVFSWYATDFTWRDRIRGWSRPRRGWQSGVRR
jgi:hypothetical protein